MPHKRTKVCIGSGTFHNYSRKHHNLPPSLSDLGFAHQQMDENAKERESYGIQHEEEKWGYAVVLEDFPPAPGQDNMEALTFPGVINFQRELTTSATMRDDEGSKIPEHGEISHQKDVDEHPM
jgi:hypothetical protein